MLNQKKELYGKLLSAYDYKGYYRTGEDSSYDDLIFIDKYRIIDLFLRLIDSFDPVHDLANSMHLLDYELEKWNNDNPQKRVDKEYLFEKYYLLTEGDRVIIHPELAHSNTSRYKIDTDCIEFIMIFAKTMFLYPLFQESRWEAILKEHNSSLTAELTKEMLIGDNKDLHGAIFQNYRNLKNAFLEALKRKISFESYDGWRKNIEYYFTLLMEISGSEIDISDVIQSMDKNKKKVLSEYSFNRLKSDSKHCRLDDLNFMNRLRYVPYELEGENIFTPGDGSRLIAYIPGHYDNINIFDRLREIDMFYGNIEFHIYYSKLIKEISFVFTYFDCFFTAQQLEEIICEKRSNIYMYYFSNYIINKNHKLLEFRSVFIAPLIIERILMFYSNYYRDDKHYIFTEDFQVELLKFYISYIREYSLEHFEFILDLYLYLSRKQIMNGKSANLLKNVKSLVIDELFYYIDDNKYLDILNERLGSHNVDDNFHFFDLFSQYKGNNTDFISKMAALIIRKYIKLLNSDKFYSSYYNFKGMENLLKALAVLKSDRGCANELYIDFSQIFNSLNSEKGFDWSKYFSASRKLRFHLGMLCLFIEKQELDLDILYYVLNSFKQLKAFNIREHSPLSWEEMIQDSFGIYSNYTIANEEILAYQIFKLLLNKDDSYIKEYVECIKDNLEFFEVILLNKVFRGRIFVEEVIAKDVKDIRLGMAMKNAYFLINNSYPSEAVAYIEYIEEILQKNKRTIFENDFLNLLKYYCFINVKEYDKAIEAVNEMSDKRKNAHRIATVEYLRENYHIAKQLFEKYFKNEKPEIEAIVNYSAVLISMGMNKEAIEWCEKYIDEYKGDYLLNANLACAYSSIDNIKSLYYYSEAKLRKPEYEPAVYGIVENINNIVGKLPDMLDSIDEFVKKRDLAAEFTEASQNTIKMISPIAVTDDELRILKDINKAIQLVSEKPVNIEKLSENELSDILWSGLKMSLNHYGYEVSREAPQGYASSKSGELDFFIYKSGEDYMNIATGENKEWAPEKFKKQLGQLFGYLREYGGFGFTIVFNKRTRLEKVLYERKAILENYYFEDEEGKRFFNKEGPIIDMTCYSQDLKGVIMTLHKNPEIDDSYVRIYHFIVNVSREERKRVAKQARRK